MGNPVPLQTLKKRAEFSRVRSGRKWVAPGFILQALPRPDSEIGGGPRFGFAVGSKALSEKSAAKTHKRPGAVLRNRARRRLKEAVRLSAPHFARPNYDYVVIGRREALHQSFADLLEDFRRAFEKVHRLAHMKDGRAQGNRGRIKATEQNSQETERT